MNSIPDISNELRKVEAAISTHSEKIQHELDEITRTIDKVQCSFGDQQEGAALINTLLNTIKIIVAADSSLYISRQSVNDFIQQLYK